MGIDFAESNLHVGAAAAAEAAKFNSGYAWGNIRMRCPFKRTTFFPNCKVYLAIKCGKFLMHLFGMPGIIFNAIVAIELYDQALRILLT